MAIAATGLATIAVVVCSSFMAIKNSPGIAAGVYAESIDLSGMSRAQAAAAIDKAFVSHTTGPVLTLCYDGKKTPVTAAQIKLSCNGAGVAAAAAKIGNEGNFISDLADKISCAYFGKKLPLEISYDKKSVIALVDGLAAKIDRSPVDAKIVLGAHGIEVEPGKTGLRLEKKQLLAQINAALMGGRYPQQINLPISTAEPDVSKKQLMGLNTILASYTTYFRTSPYNRAHNIDVASEALSGTLVKKGKIFSFNSAVGPRVTSKGYKEAPVIIDGKLVPGIGGGVCQVSSTLYNAILLAGLMPVERAPHYLPVSYVPPGRDATVAYGVIDFRFKNNLPGNVYIISSVKGRTLTVYILGKQDEKSADVISLVSEKVKGGVSVYRLYEKNGQVVRREFLHKDL